MNFYNIYSAFKTFIGSIRTARMGWDRKLSNPTMATKQKPEEVLLEDKQTQEQLRLISELDKDHRLLSLK